MIFCRLSGGKQLPPVIETMEGLYFEVKPRRNEALRPVSSDKPRHHLTPNHRSCPSLSHLTSTAKCLQKLGRERTASWGAKMDEEGEEEEEVRYKLTMIGFQQVHHLTTMAMLPWVVAEISRQSAGVQPGGRQLGPATCNQTVFLCVSASRVQCVSTLGERLVWDPLRHTVLFECLPHHVTKLIHNSQEPSSFACLVRAARMCACYVFQCQDSTKVCMCA